MLSDAVVDIGANNLLSVAFIITKFDRHIQMLCVHEVSSIFIILTESVRDPAPDR